MPGIPILCSARPGALATAASVADGIEVKLDWEHAARLGADRPLAAVCAEQGVDPGTITSVHLPPGTARPEGMSIAPGNAGVIADFTHAAFGDGVAPEWLTVHTAREFDYREQVDRLGTTVEVGGYPLAVENTPDASDYHTPEDLAVLAYLTERIPRLADVSVLVDTAHVAMGRRDLAVDEDAVSAVLRRLDDPLRDRMADGFREFLRANVAGIRDEFDPAVEAPDEGNPWRPVFVTLAVLGGSRVRALHLNHPATDGLPTSEHRDEGLEWVLAFCQHHGIAVVIEPGRADAAEIQAAIATLRECL